MRRILLLAATMALALVLVGGVADQQAAPRPTGEGVGVDPEKHRGEGFLRLRLWDELPWCEGLRSRQSAEFRVPPRSGERLLGCGRLRGLQHPSRRRDVRREG